MEIAVGVAVITGLLALFGTLANALITRANGVDLTNLRAELDKTKAAHESRLRIEAEVRLKLFERSATAAEESHRELRVRWSVRKSGTA